MGKKKKEIRIIKVISNNEEYTFVTDYNLNNTKTESINNKKTSDNKPNDRVEKKIYSKKSYQKGRKILGKSLQGHSPVYE
jgi:hypothetical protein